MIKLFRDNVEIIDPNYEAVDGSTASFNLKYKAKIDYIMNDDIKIDVNKEVEPTDTLIVDGSSYNIKSQENKTDYNLFINRIENQGVINAYYTDIK
jgi:hypothetical protein